MLHSIVTHDVQDLYLNNTLPVGQLPHESHLSHRAWYRNRGCTYLRAHESYGIHACIWAASRGTYYGQRGWRSRRVRIVSVYRRRPLSVRRHPDKPRLTDIAVHSGTTDWQGFVVPDGLRCAAGFHWAIRAVRLRVTVRSALVSLPKEGGKFAAFQSCAFTKITTAVVI